MCSVLSGPWGPKASSSEPEQAHPTIISTSLKASGFVFQHSPENGASWVPPPCIFPTFPQVTAVMKFGAVLKRSFHLPDYSLYPFQDNFVLGLKCSSLHFPQVHLSALPECCAVLCALEPGSVVVVLLLHIRLRCSLVGGVVGPESVEWLSARSKVSTACKTRAW